MLEPQINRTAISSAATLVLVVGSACSEQVLTLRAPDSLDNVLVLNADPTTAMVIVGFAPNKAVMFEWSCPEPCLGETSVSQSSDEVWVSTADLPVDEQLDGVELTCT